MRLLASLALVLLALTRSATAQFGGFFDQMFGGGNQQHRQQKQQQQQQHHPHQHGPQDNPSDQSLYRQTYEGSHCSRYLCPDTLACVHFPHHCPCAFPAHEDKFELAEGQRICLSKGGFKADETARKVELARKGLL